MTETDRKVQRTGSGSTDRVMVTGGASGIGRATALALVESGALVAIVDVDAEAGQALEQQTGGSVRFFGADVSREEEARAAVAQAATHLGGIDVLITAAGIMRGQLQDIGELTEATWDSVVDINLKGAFLVTKYVAPIMLDRGRGVIILVGSKAGVVVGSGSFAYGASKGGIHGLALALDRHLSPRGIRINELCPGDVDTPLFRRSVAEGLEQGGDLAAADRILQELAAPEDIADVLVFLASDAASAVRGTVFTA